MKKVDLNKIIDFPVLSELDRQFLELEKQQELIREQAKRIEDDEWDKIIEGLLK